MDFKTIKNTKHYLYDDITEFMIDHPNIPIRHNWRHGEEGEWVFTDDGFVCQILRKSIVRPGNKKKICIRTVCGTYFACEQKREMLGENGIPENIYSVSGTNRAREDYKTRGHTSRELIFARYVASGINSIEAYKMAFPDANSKEYIKRKTDSLLKTESIQKMVKEEIREILEKEGVSNEWIIERYKTIADMAENDTHKLKSLDSLAKIAGLFDTEEKKSEKLEIWAGFSPEQLEGVKKHGKPELIASAEKNEEEKAS